MFLRDQLIPRPSASNLQSTIPATVVTNESGSDKDENGTQDDNDNMSFVDENSYFILRAIAKYIIWVHYKRKEAEKYHAWW